jgi:hypothetical protein
MTPADQLELDKARRIAFQLATRIKRDQFALRLDPNSPGADIKRRCLPGMIQKRDEAQATVDRLAPLQTAERTWRPHDSVTWSRRTTPLTADELAGLEIPAFLKRS